MELLRERSAPVGGVSTPPITLEPNARVWEPKAVEEIIIVGMGMSSIQLMSDVYGNLYREEGKREFWVINSGAFLFQHDLVFNMRDLTVSNLAGPGVSYLDTYKNHDRPVITTRYIKEIKNCYEYPWEKVFNTLNDYYFASSPAYIIALAMISLKMWQEKTGKPGVLRLYGLDFNYPGKNEYESGRCCVEYWVGRAKEAGIVVLLPEITSLCDQSLRSTGPQSGLQGNGFCYGMHDVTPVFGVEDGKLFLKAFKEKGEAPRIEHPADIAANEPIAPTDDPGFPVDVNDPYYKQMILHDQLQRQMEQRAAATAEPNGDAR